MLQNPEHICKFSINSDEVKIGNTKLENSIDIDFLKHLCDYNGIGFHENHDGETRQLIFS